MENISVSASKDITYIEIKDYGLRVCIQKNRKLTDTDKGTILEATLYKEHGVFVNDCSYYFEVVTADNKPVHDKVDLTKFHEVIDFFFKSLLDTEYFVKSTPRCSNLFKGDRSFVWG